MMYIRSCIVVVSCCIVKLPDEVCVSHTKRVGEIKKLYNYSSQSAAHLYHAKNMSHLAEIYRLFPRRITAEVVFPNDVHP